MERLICLIVGYAFGLFQTGYLFGKMVENKDIRHYGSHNAGSTNVLRVWGKKAGLVTFAGDCGKAMLAIALVRFVLFPGRADLALLVMYTAFGVTLGHDYPFYLHFKGGKGIACLAGIIMSLSFPMTMICLAVFAGAVIITHYVSLGSVLVAVTFAIYTICLGAGEKLMMTASAFPGFALITAALAALAIWRHRANIWRLIHGTENKIW